MVCEGPKDAGLTVILEAGAFGFAADWAEVQARLAADGVRSCAYDRAGMGYSDPGPEPRDGLAGVEDLEALLAKSGEPDPYVIVGHSMAGLRVWLYARRNPDKTAGMVLVDATTPELSATPSGQAFLGPFTAISHLAAWTAWTGLLRPLAGVAGDTIGLPPQAKAEKIWAFADARHNRTAAEEVEQWPRAAAQAAKSGPLDPDLPVAVVTAGHHPPEREDLQAAPAHDSRHGYVANVQAANHASLLGHEHADAIVKAIEFVRTAAERPIEDAHAAE
jgi:pimeloyl-ACP methyl ester carboxylesterase